MASRTDGTPVPQTDALIAWADVAYDELKCVSRTYNRVINYAELRDVVQGVTGVSTNMLLQNWIGRVLEIAAQRAADAQEPPLTSLCVRGDGTIGEGYERAPRFAPPGETSDVERLAAKDRLLCYQRFATDLPEDGGTPTFTPELELRRRKARDDRWLEELIAAGSLTIHDRVPFDNHLEVARLFGREYKGHQSATIVLDDMTQVWFPKIYPNKDWDNSMTRDGEVITMRHVPGGNFGSVMNSEQIASYNITFAHTKPAQGPHFYMFLGVFEGAPHLSDGTKWVYQRVSESVSFDSSGGFSFEPFRTRPTHDDQAAEAADADPRLILAYKELLESGAYSVEDHVGASKVRGSAQAVFAKAVKDDYGWECAVTGINTREFLVASHIIPWCEDDTIRLDPTNGICLSTFVDRAFDVGYLTITPEGRTSVRWEKVDNDPILKLELNRIDDVELEKPTTHPPDPDKLARRIELGY